MKKLLALILALAMIFALCACGGKTESPAETKAEPSAEPAPEPTQEPIPEPDPLDEEITLTIPASVLGEITAEQVENSKAKNGYKSAELNSDGSVTYVMTEGQRQELAAKVADSIEEEISGMLTSGDYPNFKSIDANEDYTEFKVVTSSEELSMGEMFSAPMFYALGGMYNAYTGNPGVNIRVQYINQDSGSVIEEGNSSKLG